MKWSQRVMDQGGYLYSTWDRDVASVVYETAATSPIGRRGWHLWIGRAKPTVHPTLRAAEKALEEA